MLADVPILQRSVLLVRNAGAIAEGGGEVILLLVLELIVLSVVLSVMIVSPIAASGNISNATNNNILYIRRSLSMLCHLLNKRPNGFDVFINPGKTNVLIVNCCF